MWERVRMIQNVVVKTAKPLEFVSECHQITLAYIPYHISKTISIGIQMLMFYHLFPTRIAIKWAIHHFQTSHMVGLCIYIHIYISHYISEYLPLYSYSMHNITYPMIFHSYIPVCVCVYILYIYTYIYSMHISHNISHNIL